MGQGSCGACTYPYDDDWGRLYCPILDRVVKRSATCDHFLLRPTSENSGYTGGSECFLTSACVDYLGKGDDCYELTVLRKFRDEYLVEMDGGKALIAEYYAIAPNIVEKINVSLKRDAFYAYIYEEIKKCITFIENNQNAEAVEIYKNMVLRLKEME